jgi:TetR/AcrR family transcriptional repressor of nem operon
MINALKTRRSGNVGRPRQFDEGAVLDAAIEVFWRQGYENTSMADLLKATGLHKGSLYQSFGDKHTLFITALRRYIENLRTEMSGILLSADTAIEGMRAAMRRAVMMYRDDSHSRGCMILNTLVEQGSHDEEIMQLLENTFKMRINMITQAVKACQQEGSIRSDWETERIVSMIATTEAGLAVTLQGPVQEERAFTVIDDLLSMLRTPVAA